MLEELTEREIASDEERFNNYQANEKKNELDRIKVARYAKESDGEVVGNQTSKRQRRVLVVMKSQRKKFVDQEVKLLLILREKNEVELEMRKQELEMKKQQLEADKKRQDEMLNLLMQQNTLILNLIHEKSNTK